MWLLLLCALACADPPSIPSPAASSVGGTVGTAFPPPPGAVRVQADGFGASLRQLPLRDADAPVQTWDGRVAHQHRARVVDLPLVKGDLQQCADSILRLRGEYLRDHGEPVMFHATSGDPIPWARYQSGDRARAVGNGLQWSSGKGPASWDTYLSAVFMWAGTDSLQRLETVPDDTPSPGDILVEGGFPGHAVLILDVATRGEQTFLLVGEGFMPAQDFHVELGPEQGWWDWADGVRLPHWPLPRSALRTWKR